MSAPIPAMRKPTILSQNPTPPWWNTTLKLLSVFRAKKVATAAPIPTRRPTARRAPCTGVGVLAISATTMATTRITQPNQPKKAWG